MEPGWAKCLRNAACLFFFAWLSSPASVLAEPDSEPGLGYSLADDWGELWRRILDRNGRADPNGPIQQRFAEDLYPEHEVDQMVADFPLATELAWQSTKSGARFWAHSYDAISLGTQIQLKTAVDISDSWQLKMQFFRHYTRNIRSDLFQVDWYWQPKKKRSWFVDLRFFPRVEKQDTEVGAQVGYRDDSIGSVSVRMFALNTFANASYWLVSQRDDNPQFAFKQLDLPLAFSLQASTVRLRGFRTELYMGIVVPQSQRLFFGDGLEQSELHKETGYLGGALVEWQPPEKPLWFGASGLFIWNKWSSESEDRADTNARIKELTIQSRLWTIWKPRSNLQLEAQARFTSRPEDRRLAGNPLESGKHSDLELIASLRTQYMFSRRIGVDVSYWHRQRNADGPPIRGIEGVENRIVPRLLFDWDSILVSFGVGWDPFPRRSFYAGGGGTFIVKF